MARLQMKIFRPYAPWRPRSKSIRLSGLFWEEGLWYCTCVCVCAGFRQFLASNHPTFSVLGDVKHPYQGILEYSTQILLTQPCFKDWAHFISHIRHIGLRCVMSPYRGDQKMRADISFQL